MPDGAPQSLLFSARPTIRVDGNIQQLLADQDLLSLLVEETTLGLFRCEANFRNWGSVNGGGGFFYFDPKILRFRNTFFSRFPPPPLNGPLFSRPPPPL